MMREHGIFTSKADFWIHFFPLEGHVYWYRREIMADFIQAAKLAEVVGFSKNSQPTGKGFLVDRHLHFIHSSEVPRHFYCNYVWDERSTQREIGLLGERITDYLIEEEIIRFPRRRCLRLGSATEQFDDACDAQLTWLPKWTFEIKTETPKRESWGRNLFVQRAESGHDPNLFTDENGQIARRVFPLDELKR